MTSAGLSAAAAAAAFSMTSQLHSTVLSAFYDVQSRVIVGVEWTVSTAPLDVCASPSGRITAAEPIPSRRYPTRPSLPVG